MTENTETEIAAVRRLVAKQIDVVLLSQMLGLDETERTVPLCSEHGTPKTRRGDNTGWRCRRCDERNRTRRAAPGRPKG